MTNAEKYLKDGVDIKEFAIKLTKQISKWDELSYYSEGMENDIVAFLEEQTKPSLTEDERVILRNIDQNNFKTIGRNKFSLYLGYAHEEEKDCFINYLYHSLFKFIKERRRILYRGTFERRINGTNKHIHKQ